MGTADEVREVSYAEGAELFDRASRRLLGISGAEWLERFDRGDYRGDEDPKFMSLWMLLPFVRPVTSPTDRVAVSWSDEELDTPDEAPVLARAARRPRRYVRE